jgi:hypothetical protein
LHNLTAQQLVRRTEESSTVSSASEKPPLGCMSINKYAHG